MNLRQRILYAAYNAGEGHIPSAFSILDIVQAVYDVKGPSDRFILSKGHGCLALYAVLESRGMLSPYSLDFFARHDLGGHPDRNKVSGVEASTGSLGHGLPIAVGMALAKKIKEEDGHVYCLIGDGEANEGSIWEAALLAAHHNLDNLTVIVDYNHSTDRAVALESLTRKFSAFGFASYYIPGHNPTDLKFHLQLHISGPIALIAETVKGAGCARMSDPSWHHRAPTADEFAEIMKELE
jgi:transketolase